MKCHRLSTIPPPLPRRDREIIGGLLAAGEVAAIVGAPGSGKSALAVLIAQAVATGESLWGRQSRQGGVVYVAAERGLETIRRLSLADGDPLLFVVPDRPELSDKGSMAELAEAIADATEGETVRLIVVDTLAASLAGLDENSTKDMGAACAALRRLLAAFPDAALLLIHHSGRDGTTRGSSVLTGDADLILTVTGTTTKIATVSKANAVREGQAFAFSLCTINDQNGEAVVIATPEEAQVEAPQPTAAITLKGWPAKALTAITASGSNRVEIDTARRAFIANGGNKFQWRDALKALTGKGLITHSGDTVTLCENAQTGEISHTSHQSHTREKSTRYGEISHNSQGTKGCEIGREIAPPYRGAHQSHSGPSSPQAPADNFERQIVEGNLTVPASDFETPNVETENLPTRIDDADRAGWDRDAISDGDSGTLIDLDDLDNLVAPLDAKPTWSPLQTAAPASGGRQVDAGRTQIKGVRNYTFEQFEVLHHADFSQH